MSGDHHHLEEFESLNIEQGTEQVPIQIVQKRRIAIEALSAYILGACYVLPFNVVMILLAAKNVETNSTLKMYGVTSYMIPNAGAALCLVNFDISANAWLFASAAVMIGMYLVQFVSRLIEIHHGIIFFCLALLGLATGIFQSWVHASISNGFLPIIHCMITIGANSIGLLPFLLSLVINSETVMVWVNSILGILVVCMSVWRGFSMNNKINHPDMRHIKGSLDPALVMICMFLNFICCFAVYPNVIIYNSFTSFQAAMLHVLFGIFTTGGSCFMFLNRPVFIILICIVGIKIFASILLIVLKVKLALWIVFPIHSFMGGMITVMCFMSLHQLSYVPMQGEVNYTTWVKAVIVMLLSGIIIGTLITTPIFNAVESWHQQKTWVQPETMGMKNATAF